jgi:hypothetical protein
LKIDAALVTDKLETLILYALDAKHENSGPKIIRRSKGDGMTLEHLDQGSLLHFEAMSPASAYTFDMLDKDRLVTTDHEYLAAHPSEILGDESEFVTFYSDTYKWTGFRRLHRAPKGVACLGRVTHWYEMHIRCVSIDGNGDYHKRVVPIDQSGKPLLATIQNNAVCNPRREGYRFISGASIIEDAHRSGTMLAAVKDATEIKFPIPIGDYKDVFAKRDGPMSGSRRKAIVHWVMSHIRRTPSKKETVVKQHTRGVQEFMIDGLRIVLTPNGKQ